MYTRFDHEARIAVSQATDEARSLGHPETGPDHVLLGLLANVRGQTYAVLTRHGLHFDVVREAVIAQHAAADQAETAEDSPGPIGGGDPTSTTADYDEDRAALRAIGIDLDQVREAVRSTFGEDITDRWGERGDARRGRHHGGRGGGRGRRGPGGGRPAGRRGGFSPALRHALHEVRADSLRDGVRDDADGRRGGPRVAMTAGLLALAIIRSDDSGVQVALAGVDDLPGLRAELEALAGSPIEPTGRAS
jgi:hypothetical protein